MGGYGQRAQQKSRGVHDQLFAKALYLDSETGRFLMITSDLLCIPNDLAQKVSREIAGTLDISEKHICITASHTHSGPETMEFFTQTPEVEQYMEFLGRSLPAAAEEAVNDAEPCRVRTGTGTIDFLVNRRTKGDPNRVDNRIFALMAETASGTGKAVLFGCGCHAVTLGHDNYLISADYPGFAQKHIEEQMGVDNALFFNMAEGNVIPDTREIWDSLDTRGYLGGSFKDAEKIGARLANAVTESLKQKPFMTDMFLASCKRDCVIMPNLHDLDDVVVVEELARNRSIIAEYLGEDSLNITPEDLTPLSVLWRDASRTVVERKMTEAEMRRLMTAVCNYFVHLNKLSNPAQKNPIHVPIQVVCIQDFNFLALPGEVLVENALDWRARNAGMGAESFVIGLANGFMGYLPHKSNFEEPDAHFRYETIMNALEPAATDVALQAGARLTTKMRRQ
jgi:hypothetical protein